MPKVVESAAREMILRVKDYCEAEKMNQSVIIPLHNVRARVAAMTGVSERTVSRIVRERNNAGKSLKVGTPGKKRMRKRKINLNELDFDVIRRRIQEFYVLNQEMISVNKLRLVLKDDINYQGSTTTLRRILKSLGIKFSRNIKKRSETKNDDQILLEVTPVDNDTPMEYITSVEDITATHELIPTDDQISSEITIITDAFICT